MIARRFFEKTMSTVSIKNLVKRYDNVIAVDDISFDIAEGEFFSILGPSGCGKSTTLRMLAGFEEITSGHIEISGHDISGLPPEKRDIGFVFQNYAIFPHMNVFENIAFGLRLRNFSDGEIRTKVSDALEQVGMPGLEARMQSEMSGGQQQRIALARVLVTEPKILLLDEPLSALDKNLREEMKFWIKNLQTSLGITTIYVTHDQGEALTMSDRIAVMSMGKVAQIGTPKQIYEVPDNHFVAEFIGESSLLSGTVKSVDSDICTITVGGTDIKTSNFAQLSVGDHASLVLRPEHLVVGNKSGDDNRNRVLASVKNIVYQGATIRFELEFADQMIVGAMSNLPGSSNFKIEDQIEVSWCFKSARALKNVTE